MRRKALAFVIPLGCFSEPPNLEPGTDTDASTSSSSRDTTSSSGSSGASVTLPATSTGPRPTSVGSSGAPSTDGFTTFPGTSPPACDTEPLDLTLDVCIQSIWDFEPVPTGGRLACMVGGPPVFMPAAHTGPVEDHPALHFVPGNSATTIAATYLDLVVQDFCAPHLRLTIDCGSDDTCGATAEITIIGPMGARMIAMGPVLPDSMTVDAPIDASDEQLLLDVVWDEGDNPVPVRFIDMRVEEL